jgi:hypothetical protein
MEINQQGEWIFYLKKQAVYVMKPVKYRVYEKEGGSIAGYSFFNINTMID